jgi:hypothetical protein
MHLDQDLLDHRGRGQRGDATGPREVVNADLRDGEPAFRVRMTSPASMNEPSLQSTTRSRTVRRQSLNAKLTSRSRVPKESWISQL